MKKLQCDIQKSSEIKLQCYYFYDAPHNGLSFRLDVQFFC